MTRAVNAEDVEGYAKITGDANPVHLDEAYAATTRFKQRIAHGMLAGSFISALLGTRFPGPGTIYLKQDLAFRKPVYLGDVLEVTATVTSYQAQKAILRLATVCRNQRGEIVVEGEAVCLVSEVSPGGSPELSGAAVPTPPRRVVGLS